MNKNITVLLALLHQSLFAQAQTKVIDMHIHSYAVSDFNDRQPPTDSYGKKGSQNAEAHRLETFAEFKRFNIVKAMVSGDPESVDNGVAKDSNNRVIKGILIYTPSDYGLDSTKFEQLVKDKKIEVFGEVAP